MLNQLAVLGSGSWATALVKIFAESRVHVNWHVRTAAQASYIISNGRNPNYLSFADLHMQYVHPSASVEEVVKDVELVVFAVPAAYLPLYFSDRQKTENLFSDKKIAVSIKGLIQGTGLVPGMYLRQQVPGLKETVLLAGPCHAEEVAMNRNTYLTVAGANPESVGVIADALHCEYLRVIRNDDPVGVEYAAILKNIIGIASGIASGLNFGDNFQAVLISNAMREIDKFLYTIDNKDRDIYDSAYFGDMLVTAYSDFSRNRTFGRLIGRGLQPGKALQAMEMVAEGYMASKELAPLIEQTKLHLPVINGVYRMLHKHANPFNEFKLIEKHLR